MKYEKKKTYKTKCNFHLYEMCKTGKSIETGWCQGLEGEEVKIA